MNTLKLVNQSPVESLWNALDAGKTVHWGNDSYKIYISDAIPGNAFQESHFTYREGKVLSARCISNYFGSLLHESDVGSLYIKE